MNCDHCEMLAINGRNTHERGCPYDRGIRCEGCKRRRRNARQRLNRRWRDQAMRDLGLVKVRGAMGGTYYE